MDTRRSIMDLKPLFSDFKKETDEALVLFKAIFSAGESLADENEKNQFYAHIFQSLHLAYYKNELEPKLRSLFARLMEFEDYIYLLTGLRKSDYDDLIDSAKQIYANYQLVKQKAESVENVHRLFYQSNAETERANAELQQINENSCDFGVTAEL